MITGGYLGRYAGQYFGRYFGGLEQKANQGGGGRRRYRYVTRVRGRYRSFEDELEALAQQDPDIEAGPLPDKPVTVQELRDLGRKTEQQALVRDFLHVQRSPMAMAAFRAWLVMLLVQHDEADVEELLLLTT